MIQNPDEVMTSEKAAQRYEENRHRSVRPVDVLGARVRALRRKHDWTAERLAAEMSRVGVPWTRIIVTKLETGKRDKGVTLEELLALSYVLDIGVVNLIVPTEDGLYYWATPQMAPPVQAVRAWIRGDAPLNGQDPQFFFSELPKSEYRPPTMTPADIRAESARIKYHREHRGDSPAYDLIVAADRAAEDARQDGEDG